MCVASLRSGLGAATSRPLLAEITGEAPVEWGEACGTVLGEPSVSPARSRGRVLVAEGVDDGFGE
jgi:hypothetical protein